MQTPSPRVYILHTHKNEGYFHCKTCCSVVKILVGICLKSVSSFAYSRLSLDGCCLVYLAYSLHRNYHETITTNQNPDPAVSNSPPFILSRWTILSQISFSKEVKCLLGLAMALASFTFGPGIQTYISYLDNTSVLIIITVSLEFKWK